MSTSLTTDLRTAFRSQLTQPEPLLALAPMQSITDWDFIHLQRHYGGADVCFIEYFRVTAESALNRELVRCFTHNHTGRPTVAQMIGNDVPAMVRTVERLQRLPVAAIDLNLGCPAPQVFRKCAGGGLLRDLPRVDRILGGLRQAIVDVPFTVKTRVGVDNWSAFDQLLALFGKHQVDLVTIHGRTVKEMYRGSVHYDLIGHAVDVLPCPVLANGNIDSPAAALRVLDDTRAHGVMLGRGAIRNPWLFDQIRQALRGEPVTLPTGRDILDYLRALYAAVTDGSFQESERVHRAKKHVNFVGAGLDNAASFLHQIRRAMNEEQFFGAAEAHLDHDRPQPLIPATEP